MKLLIINADDLGVDPERDRGIFEARAKGIVSSASFIANGPSSRQAAEQAVLADLPVGVHLNLSEGESLTGEIPGLTDTSGQLPGKQGLRDLLQGNAIDHDAIRRELLAQINRARELGLDPDHLDSHQHFHLFPAMRRLVLELADETGIRAIRYSRPAEPERDDPPPPLGAELALYRRLSRDQAPGAVAGKGIFSPDGLWGMPALNRLDTDRLCNILREIPTGCWELMTHPGYPSPQPFGTEQRRTELQALTSPQARDIITARRIRLCCFRELACAS